MTLLQSCFSLFVISLGFSHLVLAQEQNVQFNQVATLNGDMQLNRLIYPDGSKIETFSQTQRQILVNQNSAPLTANHVVGSTGQPFVQLSQSSLTITTNSANDLVGAQIEMPIQQSTLDQNGVTAANTFVAMLSEDRQTWMVMEGIKSVNTTDSTVRMLKLNALDGEYMAIGRKTVETSNVLSPFGLDQQRAININGSGIQEVEFTDGFRMTVKASQPMTVSCDVVNGVSTSMLVNNAMPVNNYRYLVRTNLGAVQPALNQMLAVVQLPLNANRLMANAQRMGAGPNDMVTLSIQQRGVLQNPGGATGNLSPKQKRQDDASSSTSKSSTRSAASKTTAQSTTSKATAQSTTSKTLSQSATSEPDASSTTSESDAPSTTSESDAQSAVSELDAQSTASESTSNSTSSSTDAAPTEQNNANDQAANSTSSSTDATSTAQSSSSQSSTSTATGTSATQQSQSQTNQGSLSAQNQNAAPTTLLLSPTFVPITSKTILDPQSGRIAATVPQLDGEFILTMAIGGAKGQTAQGATQQPATAANSSAEAPGAAVPLSPAPAAKRQAPAPEQYGLVMSMTELSAMAKRQKNGGILAASDMMTEFSTQQKSAFVARR